MWGLYAGTRSRILVAAYLAAVVSMGAATTVAAGSDTDDPAERAAREITAARERANRLADDLWSAQSQLEVLRGERTELDGRVTALENEIDELTAALESVAVGRYVSAGTGGIPLLSDVLAPNERVLADFYTDVVHDVGDTTYDEFRRLGLDLEAARERVAANEVEQQTLISELEQLRTDAEADVVRLRELEQQRLQDEAVQRALEAQRREEEQRERARAEAAERERAEQQGPVTAPAGATPGGSGAGNRPQAATYVDQMVCPVQGASAYGDTWGAPRSGGRRHQGVDMLAPIGTPLQAVVGGQVEHRSYSLGGLSVILRGDNGNRYFYAHLSAYEGGPGRYEQGQVVGYIGDTGNAYGTPHLHFEIRPGGGVQVNPTPSVRAAGC